MATGALNVGRVFIGAAEKAEAQATRTARKRNVKDFIVNVSVKDSKGRKVRDCRSKRLLQAQVSQLGAPKSFAHLVSNATPKTIDHASFQVIFSLLFFDSLL
jgi:hypothetical protein